MQSITVIVAATPDRGIGVDNKIPWNLPTEMAYFKAKTIVTVDDSKTNAVIMGKNTWLSIPEKFRPLKGRLNVVLTSDPHGKETLNLPNDVLLANSLDEAISTLTRSPYNNNIETIYIIGGAQVYKSALSASSFDVDTILYTNVMCDAKCDVFFPPIDDDIYSLCDMQPVNEENGIRFQFLTYKHRRRCHLERSSRPSGIGSTRHEEYQYLDAIRDIISTGFSKEDRTGVGTLSKFGLTSRWSLRDDVFPLLTTKKVFWRGVAEELLWFISGNTSARALQAKNIHIWDGNGSRTFLDGLGLHHREEGDLGPVYGFQWRHFGAEYTDFNTDYTGKGYDQLAAVVKSLREKPDDRRIILSAWNPAALQYMALPPCHMFAQFYVTGGELSCQMYQRSGDMGLGVPFNIASYALLTRMLAQVSGLRAGEFIHVIGDAHVYKNHIMPLAEQITRTPRPFPLLKIDPNIKEIDEFKFEHFSIEGYDPYPAIKMEMAV